MKKFLVLLCLLLTAGAVAHYADFTDVQKIKAFFVAEKTADSPVTPSQPASTGTEKRVALVIGNADYLGDRDDLPNDINDANDMAKALRSYGFKIVGDKALTNMKLQDMLKVLDDFEQQLQQGGVGLFYYSGHGLEVDGQQYIVPVDAQINSKSELPYRLIDINTVLKKLEKNKSQLNLMILDSCRNNPFEGINNEGKALGIFESGYEELRNRKDIPTGTLIASATAKGKFSSPLGIRNSVYTKHLLSYMNTEPNLEIGVLLRRVRTAVKQETNEKQIPWENGAIEGEFYFAPVHYKPDDDIKAKAEAVRKLEEKAAELKAETERQEALAKQAEELRFEVEKAKADDGWKTINRYQVKDDLVKDTKTSLMWMRCSLGQDWNGKTCKGKATEYTWDDAMKVPNNFRFVGYSDWRVPTIEELKTLVYCDNGEEQTWNMKISEGFFNDCDIKNYKQPTIMSDVFPNTPSVFFWSSSPNANSETKAILSSGISVWATAFHSGNATLWDTNSPSAVRLVRGASFNVSQSKVKINHSILVAKLEHNVSKPHKVVHHKIGKTKDSHNVYSMLH